MGDPKTSSTLNPPEIGSAKEPEAEKVLLSIRQARDSLITRSNELAAKLATAEERIAELGEQCVAAARACEAAERNVEATKSEREELRRKCEDLRLKVRNLNAERIASQKAEKEFAAELEESRRRLAFAIEERDELREDLDARNAEAEKTAGMASQLSEAKMKLAALEDERERNKNQKKKKLSDLAEQDSVAKRTRDLAVANVIKVQAQVNALKSELAVQRKQFKEDRTILEAQIIALEMQAGHGGTSDDAETIIETSAIPAKAKSVPASKAPPPPEKAAKLAAAPFPREEAAAAAAGLAADLNRLAKQPSNPGLIERLENDLLAFNERARAAALLTLLRGCAACLEVARWWRKTPEKVQLTLPTMSDGIAVLADLCAPPLANAEIADPAGAVIYAVDDDVDNCECIAMAFEKLEFQTRYSVTAELAFTQLKKTRVDMIVLDVDLPKMDGFELYARLRKIAHHAETPVVFLSGLISTGERLAALPPANHAFLSKPYNLTILGATAMTMILRRRLAAAGLRGASH